MPRLNVLRSALFGQFGPVRSVRGEVIIVLFTAVIVSKTLSVK